MITARSEFEVQEDRECGVGGVASRRRCSAAVRGIGNICGVKRRERRAPAFTLLEVMIAMGIFFMFVFSILALVSNTLRNARSLRRPQVDAGMAASVYVATNRFYEGHMSGDFDDVLDDYSWEADSYQFGPCTNLLEVDIVLHDRNRRTPPDALKILVFDPNLSSTPGARR